MDFEKIRFNRMIAICHEINETDNKSLKNYLLSQFYALAPDDQNKQKLFKASMDLATIEKQVDKINEEIESLKQSEKQNKEALNAKNAELETLIERINRIVISFYEEEEEDETFIFEI